MGYSCEEKRKAIGYLRTSSATNVGADKSSDKRQREAIEAFARHQGLIVVEWYYDAAVSGADPIDGRPGFKALLDRITGNGVRTVIVEDASRFARSLMVQEAGIAILVAMGVSVFTSRGDDLTESDDEMRVAMRQITGVFSQLEKARLVKKLKMARDRKRQSTGKCEGRKGLRETSPEVVALAKRLYRASPKTGERRSLRAIARLLADAGHLNSRGKPFAAKVVADMVRLRSQARLDKKPVSLQIEHGRN